MFANNARLGEIMKSHVTLLAALLVLSGQSSLTWGMMRAPAPGEQPAPAQGNQQQPAKDQASHKRVKIITVPGQAKTKPSTR
jgi:hypothetical protein